MRRGPSQPSVTPGIQRKFAVDALATAVLQIVAKARGPILLAVLLRVGDEGLYGVWTMLAGVVALLIPLANLNVNQGLMRYAAPLDTRGSRRLYRVISLFSWAAAAVTTACGALVIVRTLAPSTSLITKSVVVFTAVHVPLWTAVKVNSAYLRARGRVIGAQLSELTAQTTVTVVACVVFLLGHGLATVQLVTAVLLAVGVAAVSTIILTSSESMDQVSGARTPSLSAVLLFSLPFIPGAVSDWVLFVADRYVLAIYRDETAVGIYAGCYSLAVLLQLVSNPLEFAVVPVLPRLWDAGKRAEAAQLLRQCVHLMLAVLAPSSTVMIIAAPVVLTLLGSPAMAARSSTLLPLLCWGVTVFACTRLISQVPLVAHRGRSVMYRVGATALTNIALNFALVPQLGAVGSAIATLASYLLYAVLIVQLTKPLSPELVNLRRPARICLAALIPAGIAWAPLDGAAQRLAACVVYTCAYLGLAVALKAVAREDWDLLKRALRRG